MNCCGPQSSKFWISKVSPVLELSSTALNFPGHVELRPVFRIRTDEEEADVRPSWGSGRENAKETSPGLASLDRIVSSRKHGRLGRLRRNETSLSLTNASPCWSSMIRIGRSCGYRSMCGTSRNWVGLGLVKTSPRIARLNRIVPSRCNRTKNRLCDREIG
jgi:hypothetical protein